MFFSHAFQSHSQAVRGSSAAEACQWSAIRTACARQRRGCPRVMGSAWGQRALCQKQETCMPEFQWHCRAHHVTCAPHLFTCLAVASTRRSSVLATPPQWALARAPAWAMRGALPVLADLHQVMQWEPRRAWPGMLWAAVGMPGSPGAKWLQLTQGWDYFSEDALCVFSHSSLASLQNIWSCLLAPAKWGQRHRPPEG